MASRTRRLYLVYALLIVGALAFRFALVQTYAVSGGDGLLYHQLSQELRAHNRYASGPAPAPLTYTRMPGYPLFLAHIAVRQAPLSIGEHCRRATRANVLLDLGTAALVAFMLLRLRARFGYASWISFVGFAGVIAAPPLWLLASYALTEPLATFLGTAEVAVAVALLDGTSLWILCALAGLTAGLGQLTRADAICFAPAIAVALLTAPLSWKRRLLSFAVVTLTAALVFLPWPLRNLRTFGAPHPFSAYWRTLDTGTPLPMGPVSWARTWASGAPGESYIDFAIASKSPLDIHRPGIVLPAMYDSPEEHEQVNALFERYNRDRLSPEVDAAFYALAAARRFSHPFHVFVTLPIVRLYHTWMPVPVYELPMRIPWLGLGTNRGPFFPLWDFTVYACALLGIISLLRARRTWNVCALLLAPIVARNILLAFTVSLAATERHIVEIHPLLIVLAIIGVVQRGRGAAH